MKNRISSRFLAIVLLFSLLLSTGCQSTDNEQLRHVVVLKYKSSATEEQISKVNKEFRTLKDKIPGILAFERGINDSPENKDLGFTHVYLLTFENPHSRDNYLPHPKHKEFGEFLGEMDILEDVFVVDYVPTED